MNWNLEISETMHGWLRIDKSRQVTLSLKAVAPIAALPTTARPFQGELRFTGTDERYPVEGTLRLLATGPEYDFRFTDSKGQNLRCTGRKIYRLRELRKSLITCPLGIYRGAERIGEGELQYREPLWKFPLVSLRLRRGAKPARAVAGRAAGGLHE